MDPVIVNAYLFDDFIQNTEYYISLFQDGGMKTSENQRIPYSELRQVS
jgi:hypothetical protein